MCARDKMYGLNIRWLGISHAIKKTWLVKGQNIYTQRAAASLSCLSIKISYYYSPIYFCQANIDTLHTGSVLLLLLGPIPPLRTHHCIKSDLKQWEFQFSTPGNRFHAPASSYSKKEGSWYVRGQKRKHEKNKLTCQCVSDSSERHTRSMILISLVLAECEWHKRKDELLQTPLV